MRKTLTVRLVSTTRTDLVCVSCGGFRCEYAIAIGDDEPTAGIHKRCVPTRKRSKLTPVERTSLARIEADLRDGVRGDP